MKLRTPNFSLKIYSGFLIAFWVALFLMATILGVFQEIGDWPMRKPAPVAPQITVLVLPTATPELVIPKTECKPVLIGNIFCVEGD